MDPHESTPLYESGSGSGNWDVTHLPVSVTTLSNGLRILVHQRSRVPVVASQMVYRLGAGDDPPGCRGLSHLLEHLTFQGSANYPRGEIDRIVQRGGGMANAFTDHDQTSYAFAVPSESWREILAIEADRMNGCTFEQEEFRRERDVVLAELRETMDDPWERIAAASDARFFGRNHPYAHPVIGVENDLRGLTSETVREVYRRAYCPSRAVLVVAGDVSAQDVFAEAQRLFGSLPPGEPVAAPACGSPLPPAGRLPQHVEMSAPVHQERFWLSYPAPARLDVDYPAMLVLDYLLTSGETAMLWDHIVEQRRVAADVLSNYQARTRAGSLTIFGDVASGRSSQQVIAAIDEALHRLAERGPEVPDLIKAKNQLYSTWVYEIDTAADIAEMLGETEALLGNHRLGFLQLQAIREVTAQQVRDLARRFLSPQRRFVCVLSPESPGASASVTTSGSSDETSTELVQSRRRHSGVNLVDSGRVARTPNPEPQEPPAALAQRVHVHGLDVAIARLANGLEVVCVEHPNRLALATRLDICHLGMRQPPNKAGLCTLLGDMLIEGTRRHRAEELKNQLDEHGMQMSTSPSGVGLRALAHNAEEAIALLAEIAQHPTFPAEALARRQDDHLTALRVALDSPEQQAKRALTARLFPPEHPYGQLVTADTLTAIRHDDLVDFHERWFRPNGARLVIAGGLPIKRQLQLVERHFGEWTACSLPPVMLTPLKERQPEEPLQVPMSSCSSASVHLGHLGIRRNDDDFAALRVMDHILGLGAGQTDRLSHELRDHLGITYHVSASITKSAGVDRGAFSASLNTSPENVPTVLRAVADHMRRMQDEPVGVDELEAVKSHLRSSFVFGTEGLCSTVRLLATTMLHDLGLDYLERHRRELEAVSVEDVQRAAQRHLKPDKLHAAIAGPAGHPPPHRES